MLYKFIQQHKQVQHGQTQEQRFILFVDILLESLLELLAEGSDIIEEELNDEVIEVESDWLSMDILELVELSQYDVGSDLTTNEPAFSNSCPFS